MPKIPPDVTRVRAAFDGSTWVRYGKGWLDEDDISDCDPNPESDLIVDLGPLTEILDDPTKED